MNRRLQLEGGDAEDVQQRREEAKKNRKSESGTQKVGNDPLYQLDNIKLMMLKLLCVFLFCQDNDFPFKCCLLWSYLLYC